MAAKNGQVFLSYFNGGLPVKLYCSSSESFDGAVFGEEEAELKRMSRYHTTI
jgi:hypothetical protein